MHGQGMEDEDHLEVPTQGYDPVNKPKHYNNHPSGIECIQITEHMCFNLGNALKYLWRADLKENTVQDLKKAIWYINRELSKRAKDEEEKKNNLPKVPKINYAGSWQVHEG